MIWNGETDELPADETGECLRNILQGPRQALRIYYPSGTGLGLLRTNPDLSKSAVTYVPVVGLESKRAAIICGIQVS